MKKILMLLMLASLLLCFACGKKEEIQEVKVEEQTETPSKNAYKNYVDKNMEAKKTAQDVANKLSKQVKDNEKMLEQMGQ